MADVTPSAAPAPDWFAIPGHPWQSTVHKHAAELRFLLDWIAENPDPGRCVSPKSRAAVTKHLDVAEHVTDEGFRVRKGRSAVELALGHLDAAEVSLLRLAPASFVIGQLPALVAHVRGHLGRDDPRLQRIVRLADRYQSVGSLLVAPDAPGPKRRRRPWARRPKDVPTLLEADRNGIIAAFRAAAIEARKEFGRARSFRDILWAATATLLACAIGVCVLGVFWPKTLPLCFAPDNTVVCPLKSAHGSFATVTPVGKEMVAGRDEAKISHVTKQTVTSWDLAVVELLGLLGAAVAAAASLKKLRGTSTPYAIPLAAAALKLPTGAVTAVLGLLLMRGGFVPGLSDLDTSAQILAWAVVFGYAQQVFTRLVDTRAQGVLDAIGGPSQSKAPEAQVDADAASTA